MNTAIGTLWVGLGGALGSMARYQLDVWAQRKFGVSFPYGILAINLLGSFLLVFLMQLGARTDALSPTTRLALTTGVLGGFTTYSTFNYDTLRLAEGGAWAAAIANACATLFGCLAAGIGGWALARAVASGG